jgi:hypothetical protein
MSSEPWRLATEKNFLPHTILLIGGRRAVRMPFAKSAYRPWEAGFFRMWIRR